ncbi:hypothetical protein OGY01_20360 [Citrobacter sp. Cm038]|uniref:hypothetical protein n=1 Tax=Citrobacter sp. Cm038 TaxID=2985117 RepID=UPI00257854EC|nr:hypothetical protein [Citrobacter sp. Cm038]MDM2944783.1 hypothetical protein [Citrobacter sp. Cm038]
MSLVNQRRATWRAEGEAHGYRLEISGQGSIPVGIGFTLEDIYLRPARASSNGP